MRREQAAEIPRWFCERCQGRLREDGRIFIDLDADPLHWTIAHDRCLGEHELASPHSVHDKDAQTWEDDLRTEVRGDGINVHAQLVSLTARGEKSDSLLALEGAARLERSCRCVTPRRASCRFPARTCHKLCRYWHTCGPVEVVSVEEVADALGVSPRRIRALIAAGRLPATRIGRRTWAIARSEALAFGAKPRPAGRPRRLQGLTKSAIPPNAVEGGDR